MPPGGVNEAPWARITLFWVFFHESLSCPWSTIHSSSLKREAPIKIPKRYNPYYRDSPKKVLLILGNPHMPLSPEPDLFCELPGLGSLSTFCTMVPFTQNESAAVDNNKPA